MDFEERARAVLPPHISAYYAAPAGSEADLDEGDTRLVGDPVPAAGASRHRIADPLEDSPRYARTDTGSGRADGPANPPQTESVDCYSTISSTSASVLDPGRVKSPTHSSAS